MPEGLDFQQYYELQAAGALPLADDVLFRDPPDLIVLGHESFLWNIVDVLRPKGIPMVLISHGPLAAIANGQIKAHLVEPLLDHARCADIVLPVAKHTAASIEKHGIAARTVRNVVDTNQFRPRGNLQQLRAKLELDAEDILVSHASNMRPVKRVQDIVESAAMALREEPRFRYLILGDGPMRRDMEQRCHKLGVADRFRFLGWIPFSEVAPYISLADIAVLASDSEAMPYCALETMSCEGAAVVSDLPWTEEVLEQGPSLLRFPVGDIEAFAQQTLRAAADTDLRAHLDAAGRAYVERYHRKDMVIAGFADAVAPILV